MLRETRVEEVCEESGLWMKCVKCKVDEYVKFWEWWKKYVEKMNYMYVMTRMSISKFVKEKFGHEINV